MSNSEREYHSHMFRVTVVRWNCCRMMVNPGHETWSIAYVANQLASITGHDNRSIGHEKLPWRPLTYQSMWRI